MPRLHPLLAALALLLAACTSSTPPPKATPTAAATPTVEATPIAAATPTVEATSDASLIPPPPPDHVAWVIELATGEVRTLVEDPDFLFVAVDPFSDEIATFSGAGRRDFAFDGTELPQAPQRRCEQLDTEAVVDGFAYEGATCGVISPNNRWMVYDVPIPDAERPDWDQWVLDLESGETRLLQPGLRHCGGCDGVIGLQFSADGDRLWFSEFTGGRVFAADLPTHTVRLIADDVGANGIGRQPIWSPEGARMLYTDDGERVLLTDFDRGTTVPIEALSWPATFGPDGTVLYSPRFGSRTDGPRTVVVDAASLEVLLDIAGEPSRDLVWFDRPPLATAGGRLVLALERATGCQHGTTIYAPDLEGLCIADAFGAAVSPDGAVVAVAVRGQQVDTLRGLAAHDIVVIDTATGEQRTLAQGAVSLNAPLIQWNAEGTHLLVVWPHEFGI